MEPVNDGGQAEFASLWRAHRPHLIDVAFAILRDIGAAEDAVQEAFARLTSAQPGQINDHRAWLTVVTSRICLDRLGSAQARRERAHDTATIELAGAPVAPRRAEDPADRVVLHDDVGLAMLVVLQRLRPAERVAFVLHDIFAEPFSVIAETTGRPAPACRQLARRARLKIAAGGPVTAPAARPGHRLVADRFIQACATGDLSVLLPLLDPDVSGHADLGQLVSPIPASARGASRVAPTLLHFFGPSMTLVSTPAPGGTGILAFAGHQLRAFLMLSIDGGLISEIHVTVDPRKIGVIGDQLTAMISGDRH